MRKLPLRISGLATVIAATAFAVPASGQSSPSIRDVAGQECRQELRQDRAGFQRDYGGTGTAAVRRCSSQERREARSECREERRDDATAYATEYGSGKAGLQRCMIDELR